MTKTLLSFPTFSKILGLSSKQEEISATLKPYEFAAKVAVALNQNFNVLIEVLMQSLKNDFKIDRSAFFLIEKASWKLKAKIGNDLPDYDQAPQEKEMIDVASTKAMLFVQPTDGVGFDLYLIIRDERHKPIGVWAMDDTSRGRQFNETEITTFNTLSVLLIELLNQKRIYDDLTVRDPLTGLFNKRIFKDLEKDFENVTCLWQLDIDHFKKINDKYGHPAGDEVLRHLARYLKLKLRQDDNILIRNGGEEFLIIMKRVEPRLALARVQALSSQFKNEQIDLDDGTVLSKVTFSVGFFAPKKKKNFKESVSWVDKLLYQAKNNGRDRVVSEI